MPSGHDSWPRPCSSDPDRCPMTQGFCCSGSMLAKAGIAGLGRKSRPNFMLLQDSLNIKTQISKTKKMEKDTG